MSVHAMLERRQPARIVYAPNYWQWFAHHRNHGLLPAEIAHCRSQLDVIEHLGLDVFSRNIYCDEQRGWWGGLCDVTWNGAEREWFDGYPGQPLILTLSPQAGRGDDGESPLPRSSGERIKVRGRGVDDNLDSPPCCGRDRVIERTYGKLTERLRYVFQESTLVQEKFAVDDYANQLDELTALLQARRWQFLPERFDAIQKRVGEHGVVVAGELHSPLKMLHVLLGPQDTTYFLMDHPERAAELLALHEAAQLDLVRQMATAGVRVMMAMDNLDTAFHPPRYVEQYSASFYEKASRICHEHGSLFFIHACGRQRDNLRLIASLGVDGLEGVPFPPVGDVELDEAMQLAGDRLIITGGITAKEFERLRTREQVYAYVKGLFERMRPYAHRFMLSASCGTPYTAPWETIKWFRDAWQEYREL